MLKRLLLIFSLSTIPFACLGATTNWEAFNYENCAHWSMTADDFVGAGTSFEQADALASKLNTPEASQYWVVVRGGRLYENSERKFGVCSFANNSVTCRPEIDFPLAGATYKEVSRMTFKCVAGCNNSSVDMFYQMPYEGGEGSQEFGSAATKFEEICHENERARKFFGEAQ